MNSIAIKAGIFIKENFGFIVVTMLISIIMLQNCDRTIEMAKPTVKIDTVFVKVKGDVVTLPPVVKIIPGEKELQYIPDPNYEKLVTQYNKLVNEHTQKNITVDTVKIDKDGLTGFVRIEDTLKKNIIIGRKTSYSFNYPIVTKTITEQAPKKNQLYYGLGLQSGQNMVINQVNIGLLLKTKNDQIYNVYAAPTIDGTFVFGAQAYWKIKLGK